MWSPDGFRKSSYSENGPQCVEARDVPTRVDVRDTANRDAGCLTFTLAEWQAFLAEAEQL